eukprot:Pgem_evm1s7148
MEYNNVIENNIGVVESVSENSDSGTYYIIEGNKHKAVYDSVEGDVDEIEKKCKSNNNNNNNKGVGYLI